VYFDERPKERREDLYNRDRELELLKRYILDGAPLVLLLGLRRSGKTSLLKVALSELREPAIFVDCRSLEERPAVSMLELYSMLEEPMSKLLGRWSKLRSFLEAVEGVMVHGIEVKFSWSKRKRTSLLELLKAINSWAAEEGRRVILVFDEGQELAKLRGVRLLPILAYVYDHLRSLTMIFTGSKMGLLYRFLRVEDPSSPLYGRVRREITLGNFTREQSLDFLRKGFEQVGVSPREEVLEYAVDRLDGVVGWLTYFGVVAVDRGMNREVVDYVMEEGSRLAWSELENFLKMRAVARRRYLIMLKRMAEEPASWSEVKRHLEALEGPISDSDFTLLLKNLLDAGFIERVNGKYGVADPLLRYAVLRRGAR